MYRFKKVAKEAVNHYLSCNTISTHEIQKTRQKNCQAQCIEPLFAACNLSRWKLVSVGQIRSNPESWAARPHEVCHYIAVGHCWTHERNTKFPKRVWFRVGNAHRPDGVRQEPSDRFRNEIIGLNRPRQKGPIEGCSQLRLRHPTFRQEFCEGQTLP